MYEPRDPAPQRVLPACHRLSGAASPAVRHNRSSTVKRLKELVMRIVRRWLRPALVVIAGILAAATLSGSVPATAHARAGAGIQAHARADSAPMAHARDTDKLV
jgi:hypothetical protein